ncbi:MAG TPA: hypothetical protein VG370_23360, partial [Chloroflexota bacterium]|nr:hypothetical protein [Chloroflexota bacterium]
LGALVHYAIPDQRLADAVDRLLRLYLAERRADEPFDAWVDRTGAEALGARLQAELLGAARPAL